jgi:undecaprenyl diphosphate synthase
MDGNGRWARKQGKARHKGHREGVKAVRATVEMAAERGIGYLTLFAVSSANWRRP